MVEIVAHHSGQATHQVETDIERDHFLTAEEAQSYGIIDAVIAGPEATDRSLHLSRRR
jgi:ATP-dependent Clp protease protease subunit